MGERIGSYDAKTKLPEILRRVESGESFTITYRGKPVADLVPSESERRARARTAIANISKLDKTVVSDEALKSMRESGRK